MPRFITLENFLINQKDVSILLSLIPNEFLVSQLAKLCDKHQHTIRVHLQNNYIEGEDYYRKNPKIKGSKMLIAKATAIQIRSFYAEKN